MSEPDAVVEIYQPFAPVAADIERTTFTLWGVLAVGLALGLRDHGTQAPVTGDVGPGGVIVARFGTRGTP